MAHLVWKAGARVWLKNAMVQNMLTPMKSVVGKKKKHPPTHEAQFQDIKIKWVTLSCCRDLGVQPCWAKSKEQREAAEEILRLLVIIMFHFSIFKSELPLLPQILWSLAVLPTRHCDVKDFQWCAFKEATDLIGTKPKHFLFFYKASPQIKCMYIVV